MGYRADIDGLRAIAVLLVLVFHFDLLHLGEAGFIGVDIFFVISGYLISTILWRDMVAGRYTLRHFYARRIRRLAPALISVQLLVLAAGAVLLLPQEMLGLAKESLATQLYVSNIYYWRTLNYFGLHAGGAFMLHTWSLGVEEQFYLVYPLFLAMVHRWARRFLPHALLTAFLLSFGLNLALVGAKPEATFYLLPTRAWEMLAGALIPFAEPLFARSRGLRQAAGPAALGLIVLALAIHGPGIAFPGWFALLPVAAGALLLLAGTGEGSLVSRAIAIRPMTFFGRISYPLYLIHWPLNVFGLAVLPDYGLGVRWGFFGLSILIAWAITTGVEEPIRRGTWLKGDRAMVRAYFGALAAILLLVGSVWATDGWRPRFSAKVLRVADVTNDNDRAGQTWDTPDGTPLATKLRPIGAPGVAPTWFIYGDSHAGALTHAASLWLAGRGEAGQIAYHSGCPPVLDTGSPGCRAFNRQAVKQAAGRPVLLVSIWRQPLDPGYRGLDGAPLSGAAAQADFAAAIGRTVRALEAAGATVHVWEPLPTTRHAVPEAMARSLLFGPHWPVARPLAEHRAEMGFVADAFARAGIPAARRIDPAPATCPGGTCSFMLDGLPLYSDNNHPAGRTAPFLARVMAAR